ncbi:MULTISPECIES: OadG family protein [Dethiosulfovibrio]|jgi:sodium pump decarboxylase gamma subunit|uniref:OadG family protein n=2 Tax=Dethiosulfovibrio TaxID=47054 RepID=A0ABS9EQK2_9BACT|nr:MULTISPECIES: OadG family protein [Dethiosulfovibrio]MCF4113628.1 OadG family protein [Dethiosulfovibrio russensis]MCF4142098.1 OadG family protein [Dethiosulfovibrio marinus]MCF4144253.1 OadG family protein [Dethiosulfovibrio acidaminovorans]
MNQLFEGVHGAISLSLIAFSIVFFVLIGLTCVIYGIRFFAGQKGATPTSKVSTGGAPSKAAQPSTASAVQSNDSSEEIVAAITGALIAKLGRGVRIVNVRPAGKENTGANGWSNWGRFDGMQGLDRSAWNVGGRR